MQLEKEGEREVKKWKAQRLVFPSTLDAPAREGKKNPKNPPKKLKIHFQKRKNPKPFQA